MMKAMNNPLGAAGELMEAAKEGVTDMVASTMPDNYYD